MATRSYGLYCAARRLNRNYRQLSATERIICRLAQQHSSGGTAHDLQGKGEDGPHKIEEAAAEDEAAEATIPAAEASGSDEATESDVPTEEADNAVQADKTFDPAARKKLLEEVAAARKRASGVIKKSSLNDKGRLNAESESDKAVKIKSPKRAKKDLSHFFNLYS